MCNLCTWDCLYLLVIKIQTLSVLVRVEQSTERVRTFAQVICGCHNKQQKLNQVYNNVHPVNPACTYNLDMCDYNFYMFNRSFQISSCAALSMETNLSKPYWTIAYTHVLYPD
jgi:hypothetical protein